MNKLKTSIIASCALLMISGTAMANVSPSHLPNHPGNIAIQSPILIPGQLPQDQWLPSPGCPIIPALCACSELPFCEPPGGW